MSKRIKTIETLVERAQRRGTAVQSKRIEDGMYTYSMVTKEVYRVEITEERAQLFHYGTLTAEIDLLANKVVKVYGQSLSDADSVATFLNIFGFNVDFGYRPVNGGFYLHTNEKPIFEAEGFEAMVTSINENA